jgi:hypothetical protein
MVFMLVQTPSSLDLCSYEDLLNAARSSSLFILRIFKPLVFLHCLIKIFSMPSIWGSAFDVSIFFPFTPFFSELYFSATFNPESIRQLN